jgi:hypothetical protein
MTPMRKAVTIAQALRFANLAKHEWQSGARGHCVMRAARFIMRCASRCSRA